jgi:ribonucleoside-diphosphate reductase alpha chain
MTRNDMTAIQQLEMWLIYKTYWTEHSLSVTVSVKDDEWEKVGEWVFGHFDAITGVSFLPYSDHIYKQAPFQTVDPLTYEAAKAKMPTELMWDMLSLYEMEDSTTGSQTLACTSGVCDLVDLIRP